MSMGRFAIAAMAVALSACDTMVPGLKPAGGSFGGPQIGVVLESGAGTVDFGCATGTIDEPIFPGKDGLFSVKGTYRTGQSGPIKVGQIFKSQEAVYSGTIVKDAMTLSVKLEDETELGPFTLTLGAPAQVVRCR